ncbi:uncharacterized protein LOC127080394 [Lathyrus oleraceus]|uniref:uncharacterized protein LOC127080394 n=1 Tax=Pisum sativum TaxID=3888 RepID=UPI0021D3A6C2|nr:uncharacterized protein LOC127080394 [Pisum sativum]
MQEELGKFIRNEVWDLVPRPEGMNIIGTKWIYKKKSDENGTVIRNKAWLVSQGYTQIEGVYFDEIFAPVSRLESIKNALRSVTYTKIQAISDGWYCDADWANNVADRKSTSRGCLFLGNNCISWFRHVPTKRRPRTPTGKKARPSIKPHSMTSLYLDPIKTMYVKPDVVASTKGFGVPKSVVKSLEKSKAKDDTDIKSIDISDKEENVGVKKDQSTNIVNVEDLDCDDEPIGKIFSLWIAKRLKSRKGKVVESTSKSPKAPNKSTSVGPAKRWSEINVQDITPLNKSGGEKVLANVPEVPIDNISFQYVENVEKWKFVYQRRLDLERELGKDAFECKEVMDLIKEAGLMKSVASFGKCYEMLVKEFIVNISNECDNKRSKEFKKVYVNGKCVDFSPEIINRLMGRSEKEQAEVKVFDNVICREITAKQVKEWL